jgi:hypothetical protein
MCTIVRLKLPMSQRPGEPGFKLRYLFTVKGNKAIFACFWWRSCFCRLCPLDFDCWVCRLVSVATRHHVNDNTIYQMNGNTYSYKNGNLVFGVLRPSIRFLWRISIFSDNRILSKAKLVPGSTVISTSQNLCY